MKHSRKILVIFLVGLFFSLSFNAYACVVPIYGGMQTSHGSDCTMPGEESAWKFCDGFKTLAVQSGHDMPSTDFSHIVLVWEIPLLDPNLVRQTEFLATSKKGELVFPKNPLALLSVFRN